MKEKKSRDYIKKRNDWIRRRFDELREQDMTVMQASRAISDELRGQIAPDTVRTIVYCSNCA